MGHFKDGKLTVSEICERVYFSRATNYNYLRHRRSKWKLRPDNADNK